MILNVLPTTTFLPQLDQFSTPGLYNHQPGTTYCQDFKWNYNRWDHPFGKSAGLAFSRISQLSCAAS